MRVRSLFVQPKTRTTARRSFHERARVGVTRTSTTRTHQRVGSGRQRRGLQKVHVCPALGVIQAGQAHDAPAGAQNRGFRVQQLVRPRGLTDLELRRGLVAVLAVFTRVHRGAAREHESTGAVPQLQRGFDLGGVVVASGRRRAEDDERESARLPRVRFQTRRDSEGDQPLVRRVRVRLADHRRRGERLRVTVRAAREREGDEFARVLLGNNGKKATRVEIGRRARASNARSTRRGERSHLEPSLAHETAENSGAYDEEIATAALGYRRHDDGRAMERTTTTTTNVRAARLDSRPRARGQPLGEDEVTGRTTRFAGHR